MKPESDDLDNALAACLNQAKILHECASFGKGANGSAFMDCAEERQEIKYRAATIFGHYMTDYWRSKHDIESFIDIIFKNLDNKTNIFKKDPTYLFVVAVVAYCSLRMYPGASFNLTNCLDLLERSQASGNDFKLPGYFRAYILEERSKHDEFLDAYSEISSEQKIYPALFTLFLKTLYKSKCLHDIKFYPFTNVLHHYGRVIKKNLLDSWAFDEQYMVKLELLDIILKCTAKFYMYNGHLVPAMELCDEMYKMERDFVEKGRGEIKLRMLNSRLGSLLLCLNMPLIGYDKYDKMIPSFEKEVSRIAGEGNFEDNQQGAMLLFDIYLSLANVKLKYYLLNLEKINIEAINESFAQAKNYLDKIRNRPDRIPRKAEIYFYTAVSNYFNNYHPIARQGFKDYIDLCNEENIVIDETSYLFMAHIETKSFWRSGSITAIFPDYPEKVSDIDEIKNYYANKAKNSCVKYCIKQLTADHELNIVGNIISRVDKKFKENDEIYYRGEATDYHSIDNDIKSKLFRETAKFNGRRRLPYLCLKLEERAHYGDDCYNKKDLSKIKHDCSASRTDPEKFGMVNLIDFTGRKIAGLYFACSCENHLETPGFIFTLAVTGRIKFSMDLDENSYEDYMIGPVVNIHDSETVKRIINQRGVFLRPKSGYFDLARYSDNIDIIQISVFEKKIVNMFFDRMFSVERDCFFHSPDTPGNDSKHEAEFLVCESLITDLDNLISKYTYFTNS